MPRIDAVSANLEVLTAPDPAGGPATGALPTLIAAQPQLEYLAVQEAAFSQAAGVPALPTEDAPAMVAVRDALSALLTAPPWADKLALLNTTAAALQAVKIAVIAANADLSAGLSIAQSLLLGPAAALNATLAVQSAAYEGARPCTLALRSRVTHINESVLELPPQLESAFQTLNRTQSTLDDILGLESARSDGTTAAEELSAALADAQAALVSAQGVAVQLNDAQTRLTGSPLFNLDTLVASLQSTRASMAATEAGLGSLLVELNLYAEAAAGPARYARYVALLPQVQAAGVAGF